MRDLTLLDGLNQVRVFQRGWMADYLRIFAALVSTELFKRVVVYLIVELSACSVVCDEAERTGILAA